MRFLCSLLSLILVVAAGCQDVQETSVSPPTPERKMTENSPYEYVVSRATGPICVDGRLDEQSWNTPAVISGFRLISNNGLAQQQTHAKWLFSGDSLYLGVVMEDSRSPDLTAVETSHIWGDDRIEIVLDITPSDMDYYHFGVNSNGAKMEGHHGSMDYDDAYTDWNPQWQAAVSKEKGRWYLEIRLPYKSLQSKPQKGTRWTVNLCRQRTDEKGKPVYTAWNPKYRGFHYAGCSLIFD